MRLYLCCLFTWAPRAPVLEALMPGLLSKDTGPVPSGLWKVSQRDFCWFYLPFLSMLLFPHSSIVR